MPGREFPLELPGPSNTAQFFALPQGVVIQQPIDYLCDVFRGVGVHVASGLAADLGQGGAVRDHHGNPGGHSFQCGKAEALLVGGETEQVGHAINGGQVRAESRTGESQPVPDAQFADQLVDAGHLPVVPPHDDERYVVAQKRHRPEQVEDVFADVEAPDVKKVAVRQRVLGADLVQEGRLLLAGGDKAVIHSVIDHIDTTGSAVAVADHPLFLGLGDGAGAVGEPGQKAQGQKIEALQRRVVFGVGLEDHVVNEGIALEVGAGGRKILEYEDVKVQRVCDYRYQQHVGQKVVPGPDVTEMHPGPGVRESPALMSSVQKDVQVMVALGLDHLPHQVLHHDPAAGGALEKPFCINPNSHYLPLAARCSALFLEAKQPPREDPARLTVGNGRRAKA